MTVVPGASGLPRVRVLPMIPFPIAFGGLEAQCLRTVRALAEVGVPAELLDHYSTTDEFDILHLFGPGIGAYDILAELGTTRPIVISALFGGLPHSRVRSLLLSVSAAGARAVRQHTIYSALRILFRRASRVICVNSAEADVARGRYGLPRDRVSVIPNGVSDLYYSATDDLFVERYGWRDFVLFVGNIIPRKNPLRLAHVLASLGKPGVFIGRILRSSADYGQEFESLIRRTEHLMWLDGVRPDDPVLASAFAAAQLLCLPSTSETQPVAALEAMAAGTPILLGDRPYAHAPPFEAAFRCEPEEEALRSSITTALRDVSEGYGTPKLPDDYRWANVAKQVMSVYVECRPPRRH